MLKSFIFKKGTPTWVIFLIDFSAICFAVGMAYLLRFNFSLPKNEIPLLKYAVPVFFIIRTIEFYLSKRYKGIIRYTNVADAKSILISTLIGSSVIFTINLISYSISAAFIIPISIIILEFLLTCFLLVGYRAYAKLLFLQFKSSDTKKEPALIFGAGEAGLLLKNAIDRDPNSAFDVVGFIDDDKKKSKKKLEGKSIYHSQYLEAILAAKNISRLIISSQNISKERLEELIEVCFIKKVKVLNVPQANRWINGELSIQQLKEFNIEDLLGRQAITLSLDKINAEITGKTVLVSGAAGSIGSELVRQLSNFKPQRIIALDKSESDLYNLEIELKNNGITWVEIVICDINNRIRMSTIFELFKPQMVFHAAAYKHVPLMEDNPFEALNTNVLGSKIMADLSDQFKVEKFVMISTDKAVNPTNVMGASKRFAEMYTQAFNKISATQFVTTRFGNVLGSNGSVIPLFKKQIAEGGPVTVTHEEITRFFMTIPEACQLVLEAATIGKGGEIIVFDMGKSIKIKDLAVKMIRLSGMEPFKDIDIKYSGLRPGEKLYEEVLSNKENTTETHHAQLMIAQVRAQEFDTVKKAAEKLEGNIYKMNNFELVQFLKKHIPEYISKNSIYEKLDQVKL